MRGVVLRLLVVTWACVLLALAPTGLEAQLKVLTRSTTDRYIELTFGRDYDALLGLYSPDAVFQDPTGEVFQGPVAQGPVRGAETIVAMQKSWGIAEADFQVDASFTVGEYSLYRGTLNVRYDLSAPFTAIPFVTVLRAVEGHIVERTDFGSYIEPFRLGDAFDTNSEATRDVAWRYTRAYLDGDLETQASLADPDILFQDPTSQVYGPPSGELYQGSEELMRRRTQIYQNVSDFDLDVETSFVANHHAVYMGTTSYTIGSGAKYAQPAVFVVEVRNGKVTRQWDFVDYSVGPTGG